MKVHRYRHETTSRVSRGVRPSASSRSTGGGPSSTACPTASRRRSEGSGRVPTRGTDPRTAGFVRSCTLHDLCRRRRTETPTSETDENAGVTGPGSRFRPNCQSVVRSVWVVVREWRTKGRYQELEEGVGDPSVPVTRTPPVLFMPGLHKRVPEYRRELTWRKRERKRKKD